MTSNARLLVLSALLRYVGRLDQIEAAALEAVKRCQQQRAQLAIMLSSPSDGDE